MSDVQKLAAIFEAKIGAEIKPGMFGKLPLAPPGRKVYEEPKKEVKKETKPPIDYKKLKELILYTTRGPYDSAMGLKKYILALEEIGQKIVHVGTKLAFKVEEIGDKGYQNTAASEEELGELLDTYLKLLGQDMFGIHAIKKNIAWLSRDQHSDDAEHVSEVKNRVNEFAKR
jgi:hypothetical protein